MLFLLSLALAGDTWTNIRPGVDYLHRTTSDPQDIYAVRVDLSVPNVGLHASADKMGTERHVTTPTFAANADVLVAINGDWSDTSTPVGLAISDGAQWHDHIHDDTVGGAWGFLACTATKDCTLSVEAPLDSAWWFGSPTLAPYRYYQTIGANGIPMLVDGKATSGCFDGANNPRSAACLDSTGKMLWLIVADGRTSKATGLTCDQVRSLMLEWDCWSGVMLDGGGSSTLVIEGSVKNNPSDGSPRTVANHFGIIYSDTMDSRCTVANGRWCDGTQISACQGGRFTGTGDCGYYGFNCEEDGDYAYCVDPRCPNGSGSGAACLDGTHIASCNDGAYGEGDCGVFGLACGSDAGGTSCMDPRCSAGPNSSFCTADGKVGSCSNGTYSESDCGELSCWASAGEALCLDSRCGSPDLLACEGEKLVHCVDGAYEEKDCSLNGGSCEENACVGGESKDTGPTSGDDLPGDASPLAKGCGCSSGGEGGWGTVAFLGLLFWRRKRETPE